jgi:hypothetical protein
MVQSNTQAPDAEDVAKPWFPDRHTLIRG